MGSRAPIARKPSQGEPPEEPLLDRSDPPNASAKKRLLGRIAEALQVPPAVLYNPPNAGTPTRVAVGDGAPDLEQECEALSHAYRWIHDPELRLRLLRLVQAAAERD